MSDLNLAQQELLFRINQERMEYAPDLLLTWEDVEDVINTEKFWFGYSSLEAELEKV